LEEELIAKLSQTDLPLAVRAAALRGIIELRRCSAREAATFFGVEPQVTISALSLLALPEARAASRRRRSGTKAA
jgi:hypothetical protein